MKVLSIRQPWAWLIVNGHKNIENRSWGTRFRGEFLIHAGLKDDEQDHILQWAFSKDLITVEEWRRATNELYDSNLMRGAIIGKATLIDVVEEHDSEWFFGPKGFILTDAKPLDKPIPYKGKLSFFEYKGDMELIK